MELLEALDASWSAGAVVVGGIEPGRLADPTPCEGWDVRAVLNHTLGEARMMTDVNEGRPSVKGHGDLVGASGDLAAAWERERAANVASWRAGGLEGERTYFYGTYPAAAGVAINIGELVVHTWDLARATGQDTTIDAELAAIVYGLYTAFPIDGMRAGGMLGPEIPVPADAPIADRMLGLLGRRP